MKCKLKNLPLHEDEKSIGVQDSCFGEVIEVGNANHIWTQVRVKSKGGES